jgi:hypothetical protein
VGVKRAFPGAPWVWFKLDNRAAPLVPVHGQVYATGLTELCENWAEEAAASGCAKCPGLAEALECLRGMPKEWRRFSCSSLSVPAWLEAHGLKRQAKWCRAQDRVTCSFLAWLAVSAAGGGEQAVRRTKDGQEKKRKTRAPFSVWKAARLKGVRKGG